MGNMQVDFPGSDPRVSKKIEKPKFCGETERTGD